MFRSAQRHDAGSGSPGPGIRPQEGYPGPRREPLPTRVEDVPDLPPEYRAALDEALAGIDLVLDEVQREALDGHVRLLVAWNRSINLTAIRDPEAIARRHVVDSLSAVPVLRDRGVTRFVDLGSGAGYPGLPLAIALPARAALLVDSVRKKARFLEVVVDALAPLDRRTIGVFGDRAEVVARDPRQRARWPAVTARAVASLADLVELGFPLLSPGGVLVAWKAGDLDEELDAARRAVAALGRGVIDVRPEAVPALPGHRLVVVEKAGRTPDAYPRSPADRRRHPW